MTYLTYLTYAADHVNNWKYSCSNQLFCMFALDVVRSRTGQPLLSDIIRQRRLVICAVPTPVKTTPELSGPAFGVLQKTGDEEMEDRGKPG